MREDKFLDAVAADKRNREQSVIILRDGSSTFVRSYDQARQEAVCDKGTIISLENLERTGSTFFELTTRLATVNMMKGKFD